MSIHPSSTPKFADPRASAHDHEDVPPPDAPVAPIQDSAEDSASPLVLASVSDREGNHAGDLFVDEDGVTVITPLETVLPGGHCAKCGRKTSHQISRNLWWHHPALYAALIAGPLLYAPLAWFRGRRTKIDVHLCKKHRETHMISMTGATSTAVLAAVMLLLGLITLDWKVVATSLVMGVGAIFWYRWSTLSAVRIDSDFVWIRGVSPEYVKKIHSEHA